MPSSIAGRVAIVTGAAQGIGLAYARRLLAEGARVVLTDIDSSRLEVTERELRAEYADILTMAMDVSREEDTRRMAEANVERFGRIDVLVNNAAIYGTIVRKPFEEISADEWDQMMAVNVRGVFLCCKAVVPYMRRQRSGKIINISSGTVWLGTPMFLHYVATKAAVIGITRALAREVGTDNIHVNAITPGYTLSEAELRRVVPERLAAIVERTALKREQHPEHIVGVVAFLASSDSDFMTGADSERGWRNHPVLGWAGVKHVQPCAPAVMPHK